MQWKKTMHVLIVFFAAVYYFIRIGIFYLSTTGEIAFEEKQSQLVEDVVSFSFLIIGAAGLLLLPGVYLLKPWGFWGTIAVSAYTIAFDVWAWVVVQSSAAAGIIPAAVVMGYLLLTRHEYLTSPTGLD
jgi:uncharacterized membrane protein